MARNTCLREIISRVGEEEELNMRCFMGKDINSSSFPQPNIKKIYFIISSPPMAT
jgi:hypothetical protein